MTHPEGNWVQGSNEEQPLPVEAAVCISVPVSVAINKISCTGRADVRHGAQRLPDPYNNQGVPGASPGPGHGEGSPGCVPAARPPLCAPGAHLAHLGLGTPGLGTPGNLD